jgi:hypothetical protein
MLPFHLCCNLTCVEFYECDTPDVTEDVKGIEQDRVIIKLCRYLEFVKNGGYDKQDLQAYGRQNAQRLRMFCELEDIKYLRVGMKARFNLITMMTGTPYNNELKPFIYDNKQRDIIDMELHEIKRYAGLNEHYEIDFITYN